MNRLVSRLLYMTAPNHNYWQVHHRTYSLANALSIKWNIGVYLVLNNDTRGIEYLLFWCR